jgi:hypothetical protein
MALIVVIRRRVGCDARARTPSARTHARVRTRVTHRTRHVAVAYGVRGKFAV